MHTIDISLPKEIAEDLLNENKNRLVRTAINATTATADPVLVSALEAAFTEALSKVKSNASYKTIHPRRRMQTLWVIIVNDITKGEVVGRGNSAGACSPAALHLCTCV